MSKNSKRLSHYGSEGELLTRSRVVHLSSHHLPTSAKKKPGSHPVHIKLPRRIVHKCAPQKLSDAFSHHEDIEGRTAIIWCTNDARKVSHAFLGIIEKISSHASRRFALRVKEMVDPRLVSIATS